VVDDGSTDGTKELLAPLAQKNSIRYGRREAKGVSAARNHGISLARAAYIAFLDSDDLFLPTKLEKQYSVFSRDKDLGFVHCSFSKFDDESRDLGVRDTSLFQGQIYPDMLLEWSVLMAMPCMLMRTDVLKEVGGFDEQMTWAEDLDLWRRIARYYRVGVVPEALVKVRVHAASTSFDKTSSSKGFERYLEKAFAEDSELTKDFRKRATAKMYTKLAQNLLGEGGEVQMKQARQLARRALAARPFQLSASASWLVSFLPRALRNRLATGLRSARYPAAKA
jgi:glycosyltransferase involved in cell wall biosynthesis